MDAYRELVQSCIPYFSAVAQVAGGLLGLVFVALTFNIKALGVRGDPALRDLARQTFSDFLMVLLMSLIMLVPDTSMRQIGVVMMLLALIGAARIARSLVMLRRAPATARSVPVWQRFGLSLLGHVGLFAAGYVQFIADADIGRVGSLLVMSPLVLLIAGSRSAWLLVVHDAS